MSQDRLGAGAGLNAGEAADGGRWLITGRRQADILALILMLVFITSAITMSLPPVVKSDLTGSGGLTLPQYGLLSTVFLAFYGVSGISSGIFAARWGGRLLIVCCSSFFLGSLIFGLSGNIGGFLVGRALQGLGGGMVIATCSPVLANNVVPRLLNRAWGILGAGWGLGQVVGLLLLPSVENAGGYRAVFLATAGLAFVVGLAAISQKAIRLRPSHPEGATSLRGLAVATRSVITNRRVMLLGFVNAAALAATVPLLQFTPSFLQQYHGSGKDISLYLLAGLGAAQVLGNPFGAWATARWGKFAVIVLSMIPMVIATALVGIVPGVPLTFIMVLVAGFFSMAYFPPMLSYMPEVVDKPWQVGPATGLNTALGFGGSMLFPWFFGLILDADGSSHVSYIMSYLLLAVFAAVGTASMVFFKGKAKAAA
jgi:MFS family permease